MSVTATKRMSLRDAFAAEVPEGKTGLLCIMDREEGDIRISWDVTDEAEVAAAQAAFTAAAGKGYDTFVLSKGDTTPEKVASFDKDAPKTVMSPRLVGG